MYALPNMSLNSCFPVCCLGRILNDCDKVSVTRNIVAVILFIFHMQSFRPLLVVMLLFLVLVGKRSRYKDLLWLGGSGIEYRLGARFYSPVQTGPGTHPVSYAMDTELFAGLKRPGRGVNYNTYISPRLKKEYIYTSALL
jgi:hypothetical protein